MTRRATPADLPRLVRVLAEAFEDDPFYVWLIPPGENRQARLCELFDLMLRHMSDDWREAYTPEDAGALALWLRPGMHKLSLLRQARLMPAFARVLGLRNMPRGLGLMSHMDALHARYAPGPHYYLFILAVEPAQQRRGLGAALLEPVLRRCQREKLPMYLETAKLSNVPFYERQGFRVLVEAKHPSYPTLWCMGREPS